MKTSSVDLSAVAARLAATVPVNQIGGAAKYAAATTDTKAVPALFVIPLAESAGKNRWANGISQRVEATFGVVIGARNLSDEKGAAAQPALTALREKVFAALLGWMPEGCSMPITYDSGRLIDLANGIIWWQDDFTTAYEIGD
ncbi:MAG: Gp37 family protein [Betaproteobacteria bacterium]|nr:Gp37 family protein [Betaproteobacteria bacterium]